jgi:hypothetical protein
MWTHPMQWPADNEVHRRENLCISHSECSINWIICTHSGISISCITPPPYVHMVNCGEKENGLEIWSGQNFSQPGRVLIKSPLSGSCKWCTELAARRRRIEENSLLPSANTATMSLSVAGKHLPILAKGRVGRSGRAKFDRRAMEGFFLSSYNAGCRIL